MLLKVVISFLFCVTVGVVSGGIQFPGEYDDSALLSTICGRRFYHNDVQQKPLLRYVRSEPVDTRKFNLWSAFIEEVVVGGREATDHFHPWMASVGIQTPSGKVRFVCGATLISENFLLTAAHCLERIDDVADNSVVQDIKVKRKIIYPEYKFPSLNHDVALIELQRRVRFSRSISPICLPAANLKLPDDSSVTTVGWGALKFGRKHSITLQEVTVKTMNKASCEAVYRLTTSFPLTFPQGFRNGIMCAGVEGGGKDSCQGDSGGPLQYNETNSGEVVLVGIVSNGRGCGAPDTPGIYTDVSEYLDFIKGNADLSITSPHFADLAAKYI